MSMRALLAVGLAMLVLSFQAADARPLTKEHYATFDFNRYAATEVLPNCFHVYEIGNVIYLLNIRSAQLAFSPVSYKHFSGECVTVAALAAGTRIGSNRGLEYLVTLDYDGDPSFKIPHCEVPIKVLRGKVLLIEQLMRDANDRHRCTMLPGRWLR